MKKLPAVSELSAISARRAAPEMIQHTEAAIRLLYLARMRAWAATRGGLKPWDENET